MLQRTGKVRLRCVARARRLRLTTSFLFALLVRSSKLHGPFAPLRSSNFVSVHPSPGFAGLDELSQEDAAALSEENRTSLRHQYQVMGIFGKVGGKNFRVPPDPYKDPGLEEGQWFWTPTTQIAPLVRGADSVRRPSSLFFHGAAGGGGARPPLTLASCALLAPPLVSNPKSPQNWPVLMYDLHNESNRIFAIDRVVRTQQTTCTDIIQLVQDTALNQTRAAGLMIAPSFWVDAATGERTLTALSSIVFNWDQVLGQSLPKFVNGAPVGLPRERRTADAACPRSPGLLSPRAPRSLGPSSPSLPPPISPRDRHRHRHVRPARELHPHRQRRQPRQGGPEGGEARPLQAHLLALRGDELHFRGARARARPHANACLKTPRAPPRFPALAARRLRLKAGAPGPRTRTPPGVPDARLLQLVPVHRAPERDDRCALQPFQKQCLRRHLLLPSNIMPGPLSLPPQIPAGVVCIIASVTIVFVAYDYLSNHRFKALSAFAAVTSRMVDDVFPRTVRERLMRIKQKEVSLSRQRSVLPGAGGYDARDDADGARPSQGGAGSWGSATLASALPRSGRPRACVLPSFPAVDG